MTGVVGDTERLIVGLRNGRCVGLATVLSGKQGERDNMAVRRDFARRGYDIITISRADAAPYYVQMREDVMRGPPIPPSDAPSREDAP